MANKCSKKTYLLKVKPNYSLICGLHEEEILDDFIKKKTFWSKASFVLEINVISFKVKFLTAKIK